MEIDDLSNLPRLLRLALPDARTRESALDDSRGSTWSTRNGGSIPSAVLFLLEWDDDAEVCFAAVDASGVRRDGYQRLASDPRLAANEFWITNTHLLDEATMRESPLWTDDRFRAAVAERADSPDLQRVLSRDPSVVVRSGLAKNANCIDSVLSMLVTDRAPQVASAASENRRSRQSVLRHSAASESDYSVRARVGRAVSELRSMSGELDEIHTQLAELAAPLEESRLLKQVWIPIPALRDLATRERQYGHVVQAIAANLSTPPDVLDRLVRGEWGYRVAQIALANPSIGADNLLRYVSGTEYGLDLGEEQLEIAWSNPSIPEALVLGKPKNLGARRGIASNPGVPGYVLARLAQDDDSVVRHAVAANPATPVETMFDLARSDAAALEWGLAHFLVRNPNAPTDLYRVLATQPALRPTIASAPGTPPEILHGLSADDDIEVRLRVATHPLSRTETILALAGDAQLRERDGDWEHRREENIAQLLEDEDEARPLPRPITANDAAETFVRALGAGVRDGLAWTSSPELTGELEFLHSVLVRDPVPRVRASIARHGVDSFCRQLARDPSEEVVFSVALNTTDQSLAELLVGRADAHLGLAANPVTPAHVLVEIARSASGQVQDSLARHRNATSELLTELLAIRSTDSAPSVSVLVAQHPAADAMTLTKLSREESVEARQHVAAHRRTPPAILAALSCDIDAITRLVVAMNRNTPGDVVEKLAMDSDVRVRQAVAARPGISPASWTRLAVDADPTVQLVAKRFGAPPLGVLIELAGSPSTDPRLLRYLASDARGEVRTAVAKNSAASHEVLEQLADSAEPSIRLLLACRTDAPDPTLQRLVGDRVWSVRRAARSTLRRRRRAKR